MKLKQNSEAERSILTLEHQQAWEDWLSRNHSLVPAVWLRLAKKGSELCTLTYTEALETALCYGWIDAQKRPENAGAWLQRFTPRGKLSIWSKINCQKATRLLESGRMKDSGLKEMLRAKQDGRWERAYDSPSNATVPEDFQAALNTSSRAKAFLPPWRAETGTPFSSAYRMLKKQRPAYGRSPSLSPCSKGMKRYIHRN